MIQISVVQMCVLGTVFVVLFRLGLARGTQCEPIKIPMCKNLGYNETKMPNLANHNLQSDAKVELETFTPLIHSSCSDELSFFLCSVYAPMCVSEFVSTQDIIGPCRPLCERIKSSCIGFLQKFGFPWPAVLDCKKFPESNNHEHMCMEGSGERTENTKGVEASILNAFQTNPIFRSTIKEKISQISPNLQKSYKEIFNIVKTSGKGFDIPFTMQADKCSHIKGDIKYVYIEEEKKCIKSCDQELLLDHSTNNWVLAGLIITCLSSNVIAIALRSCDDLSIPYPGKMLLFMSMAYIGVNCGFLVRLFSSPKEILCETREDQHHLILDGYRSAPCFLSFLFVYFFTMSVSAWFATFSTGLLLNTALRWENSVFKSTKCWFHLFAWGISAFLTILIFLLGEFEADELSGICYVGSLDETPLLFFVILPMTVLLAISVLFLIASVGCMICFDRTQAEIKTLVFVLVFFFFQAIIVICHGIEYKHRSLWIESASSLPEDLWYVRSTLFHLGGIACAFTMIMTSLSHRMHLRIFKSWRKSNGTKSNNFANPYPNVSYQVQVPHGQPMF